MTGIGDDLLVRREVIRQIARLMPDKPATTPYEEGCIDAIIEALEDLDEITVWRSGQYKGGDMLRRADIRTYWEVEFIPHYRAEHDDAWADGYRQAFSRIRAVIYTTPAAAKAR